MGYTESVFTAAVLLAVTFAATAPDTAIKPGSFTENYAQARIYLKYDEYEDSLLLLRAIENDYTILRDYVLFDIATCYEKLGEQEPALTYYEKIVAGHRTSPLFRKAYLRSVNLRKERSDDKAARLDHINGYLKEFPGDEEIILMKADLLKKLGQGGEQQRLLKELFVKGGVTALKAFKEIKDRKGRLTDEDIDKAVRAMIQNGKPDDALDILKHYKRGGPRFSFLVGRAYFSMKKYDTAVRYLADVTGTEARSLLAYALLRSGDRDLFYRLMESLGRESGKDIYNLWYAMAESRRREGNIEAALDTFDEMLERFPDKAEETLWGAAWLETRQGNYPEAEKYLARLAGMGTGSADKYWFWLARIRSYQAADGSEYLAKMRDEKSFYSIRTRGIAPLPPLPETYAVPDSITLPEKLHTAYIRAMELNRLDMKPEAVTEIRRILEQIPKQHFGLFTNLLLKLNGYNTLLRLCEGIDDYLGYQYPYAYRHTVTSYSRAYGVDPFLVLAVMREESRYNPTIVSGAGALGLMQIMPATAKRLSGHRRTEQITNVENNIEMGSKYLSKLLKQFDGNLPRALASYNAGEHKVVQWLSENSYRDDDQFIEDIPYRETRNYVKKVLKSYEIYRTMYKAGQPILDIPELKATTPD